MKTLVLSLGILMIISNAAAQDSAVVYGQEAIESILSNSTDEQDLRLLGDELEYLLQHPINIIKPIKD